MRDNKFVMFQRDGYSKANNCKIDLVKKIEFSGVLCARKNITKYIAFSGYKFLEWHTSERQIFIV